MVIVQFNVDLHTGTERILIGAKKMICEISSQREIRRRKRTLRSTRVTTLKGGVTGFSFYGMTKSTKRNYYIYGICGLFTIYRYTINALLSIKVYVDTYIFM